MRGTPFTYYISLNRPHLILGVERRLFFVFLALSSLLVFTSLFRPLMVFISGILFCISMTIGRILTKNDANFLGVYKQHLRYRQYYEPIPFVLSPICAPSKSVPLFKRGRCS